MAVFQGGFFGIDIGWQPQARAHLHAPAIEVVVPQPLLRYGTEHAVESHDVVFLIFHPDTSLEPADFLVVFRLHIEYQAAHFAQEFAAHVFKVVGRAIEALGVDVAHAHETVREIAHSRMRLEDGRQRERRQMKKPGFFLVGLGQQRLHSNFAGNVSLAQIVFVAGGHQAEILVGAQILNVNLRDGMEVAHPGDQRVLLPDHPVKRLV